MAESADGKLRFSRQEFLVFVRETSHLTLETKSKYAEERSTAYKVGGLEFISEKACFPVPRTNAIFFWQDRAGNNTASFSEFSKYFPVLSAKYSRSVVESHQLNY